MARQVTIFSPGLWRLKDEVATLSGLEPVRGAWWRPLQREASIAGWGHKATAVRARAEAARAELPYLAFEDGFIRSIRPGPSERPLSMIMDRTGIYYDASRPSDLEVQLNEAAALDDERQARAAAAIDGLRGRRLSKYNDAPDDRAEALPGRRRVLVADQTFQDASIAGGLADASSFEHMLAAAVAENPGAHIIVKLHPEVVSGRKRGYLAGMELPPEATVLARSVNPWALIDQVDRLYTVSSQLGFEALMAGRDVVCFGMPFYAGWGLTQDRVNCLRRTSRLSLAQLVDIVYFGYCRYLDAWTRRETDFFTALDQLAFLRQRYLANARPVVGYRITAWKRRSVRAFLDGPAPVRFRRSLGRAIAEAKAEGGAVAAWGAAARRVADPVRQAGVGFITIEDGFLRSVGLGASFTPALSYVFDGSGIYYDPTRASDLERILETHAFDSATTERARRLIEVVIEQGVTKYNPRLAGTEFRPPDGREVVLVPGQVADDEAVRLGAADLYSAEAVERGGANLALLMRVRARRPDAFIVYRPHPDVAAGMRAGAIPEALARQSADLIDTGSSIVATMAVADRIETLTSLAGFEALIRGKPVSVHGQPFYAGWGLTEDLAPVARRTRQLSLEELVAGVLILYPRYIDPISGRPCPVEVAVDRLSDMRRRPLPLGARLRQSAGAVLARARHRVAWPR